MMDKTLSPLCPKIKVKVSMAKRILGSGYCLKAAVVVLCVLWMPVTPAHADEYQDAISKAFPGFKILDRSEFDQEIQKTAKTNPALIVGHFNDDALDDFATIIRSEAKQRAQQGEEYYSGKEVVCHMVSQRKYQCQALSELPIFLPYDSYLRPVRSRMVGCYKEDGTKIKIAIKRDGIGYVVLDKGAGVYIYQLNGSYLNCVTAD